MNLNEYKGSFLFKLTTSSSHSFIPNTAKLKNVHIFVNKTKNVHIFVIANIQSFTSQIFGVIGPLGENLDFFSPLGIDVQTNSYHKT